jgi:hypothetical protein
MMWADVGIDKKKFSEKALPLPLWMCGSGIVADTKFVHARANGVLFS